MSSEDGHMIRAYPERASIAPGEPLVLRVSSGRPRFRVLFYRWGERLLPVLRSPWLQGQCAPARGPDQDWQWPAHVFPIPQHWPSAVYIAYLEQDNADGPAVSLALSSHAALFVVRGAGRGALLYKIALATYHAYNHSGGGCFYANPPRSEDPPGAKVSFQRPGGGIGGAIWCAADDDDPSSPRQSFAHWDAPFIAWLLRHGYNPEFCTDLDVHADPALCRRYRLLLSVGHDEYWSEAGRDHVEDFIAAGGNVAFFSANICWWRVHLVDAGRAMVCHQGGPEGALDHWWPATGAGRPEDALCGVSYRHGGGWWDGPRQNDGYVVLRPAHWVFAGTGLRQAERLGAATRPPLVGYECDGAPLARFDAALGLARLSALAPRCGTPSDFCLLAASALDARWQERPAREGHAAGEGIHAATMGVFSRGGTVFTAGTTDWAQVLGSAQEPRLGIITRNVLERLLGRDV
jgi:hypothetical protein